jgi:hypothetical protein
MKLQERDPEVEKSERKRDEEEEDKSQDDYQPEMHKYLEYREFLL